MIILGIDPGTASTGYGIIQTNGKKIEVVKCLECSVIHTSPDLHKGERLKIINNRLIRIIRKHKPDVLAIENVFFFKNLKTAMAVSQAEGAIFLMAAKKKLPVIEFTPPQIKLAITGDGKADKKIVHKKLKKLLRLKDLPKSDDAADALAIALTYFLKTA